MSFSEAYWIDQQGKIFDVNTNHVGAIIKNPAKFKMTSKHVVDTYAKYGERLGQEAEARKDLIFEVLAKGFVRIRAYRTYWAVTIDKLDKATEKKMLAWAETKDVHKKFGIYHPVKLNIVNNHRKEREVSVRKLEDGKLIQFKTVEDFIEMMK